MNDLELWYEKRSPGQKLAIKVSLVLGTALMSAIVNQRIGERRGYAKGLKDGMGPATQAQLDEAQARGHRQGYLKGIWANEDATMARELYTQGILDGSQAWMEAGLRSDEVIRRAQQPGTIPA